MIAMKAALTGTCVSSSVPIHGIGQDDLEKTAKSLGADVMAAATATGWSPSPGKFCFLPMLGQAGEGNDPKALVLVGRSETGNNAQDAILLGALANRLPAGHYHFATDLADPTLTALAWGLSSYRYTAYKSGEQPDGAVLAMPDGVDQADIGRMLDGMQLARDLINCPANDMGPDELEAAMAALAGQYQATLAVTRGDDLLTENFPMIHAVGRASDRAPRLLDLKWGDANAPKITLVGKGVCFDTGGLDLKPSSAMLLMKKDMGGAANVLGLAAMIMSAGLNLRLRVLIPAVENAVGGAAFRPGDILPSRKGLTVEIGNTDAEGRLVLGDALALAQEENPDLIIDMATLTGAARVALGPDLPPFYTHQDDLAYAIARHSVAEADPLWRMPLWSPYMATLDSGIADINHISSGPFAGSITAALFLSRFVDEGQNWVHFDIYGWTPNDKPAHPKGGEGQGIRALYTYLKEIYPAK